MIVLDMSWACMRLGAHYDMDTHMNHEQTLEPEESNRL